MAAKEIDDYLAALDEPKRNALQLLRTSILAVVPEVEECISYRLPGFKVQGETIAGFGAFKDHLSYFPHSGSVLTELADDLAGYTCTKGALHFPVDEPLPADLVRKLIAARLRLLDRKADTDESHHRVGVASACVGAGVRTGGCLCGAVRYSVRGDPVHVVRCHCADCRRESGSAFTVFAQWPVEAFEISGEISSYDRRGFCPRCGSRLLDTTGVDSGGALIEIRVGSLDDAPFELTPEHEIWVKRRESWIPPVEGAEQHEEG